MTPSTKTFTFNIEALPLINGKRVEVKAGTTIPVEYLKQTGTYWDFLGKEPTHLLDKDWVLQSVEVLEKAEAKAKADAEKAVLESQKAEADTKAKAEAKAKADAEKAKADASK